MQAIRATLDSILQAQVLKIRLNAAGLAELSAAGGYDQRVSAELMDENGEVCGRAERGGDPCASRFGPGLVWRMQVGGVLASRVWAAFPMGCGAGDNPFDAYKAAMADLSEQARRRLACAAEIGRVFGA